MAVTSERKIAAAGMAGSILAIVALLLVLAGLTLGLGARDGRFTYVTASTGDDR